MKTGSDSVFKDMEEGKYLFYDDPKEKTALRSGKLIEPAEAPRQADAENVHAQDTSSWD